MSVVYVCLFGSISLCGFAVCGLVYCCLQLFIVLFVCEALFPGFIVYGLWGLLCGYFCLLFWVLCFVGCQLLLVCHLCLSFCLLFAYLVGFCVGLRTLWLFWVWCCALVRPWWLLLVCLLVVGVWLIDCLITCLLACFECD